MRDRQQWKYCGSFRLWVPPFAGFRAPVMIDLKLVLYRYEFANSTANKIID
jgi:hypothetical protein